MDIARTLFFCLYAYCLCGFEGNIGYSTYRRIDRNQSELCSCSCSHCRRGHIWILFRRALYTSACLKRSKTFDEAYARCNTQKVTKRWMRRCWLRDVGLQINTNTNRSRAWKFRIFVFRCSVLVPNRWMWSSEHIIVGCFCISQLPLLNFLLVE